MYNTSRLGWRNVDVFTKIPTNQLIAMNIAIPPSKTTDVKLVFKERQFVLPAEVNVKEYFFRQVPIDEPVWVVALKYEHGTPMLAMHETSVKRRYKDLIFRKLTLDELKEELKKLDPTQE